MDSSSTRTLGAPLDAQWLRDAVRRTLDEDLGGDPGRDVTTQATIPADTVALAHVVARAPGVLAGVAVIEEVLAQVAERLAAELPAVDVRHADGDRLEAGDVIAVIRGSGPVVLIAERTILNLISRACGVATHTRRWADQLSGTSAQVLDTRKTTPMLRELEKYAVRCGGGTNKRMGLYDVAMVKDNHIVATGSVADAVAAIRANFPDVPIQVEVEDLAQAREAIRAGARFLLLDNMTNDEMRELVAKVRSGEDHTGRVELEATGGLTLERAAEVAATGIDYMSVGALTHSSPILDLALDLQEDAAVEAEATRRARRYARCVSDELDIPEQMRVRREKRARIIAAGQEAYPASVPRTHQISDVKDSYAHLEVGEETEDVVGVAGRVVFIRNTGKLCFAAIQDGEGERLQVMISEGEVGEDSLTAFKADVDLGDHLFARGKVIKSKRGEVSVFADSWALAAKAVRPLPVLHKDLSEESRVRQRYVDLIARPAARDMVRQRAGVMRSLRESLHSRGFIEIETPMLQTQPGGATARPFITHMNAFDIDLYLRIAPELFLKRAVVGGIERVFEINRNFRNEGADSFHSPEFAMIEAYEAYGDYRTMATLTRELIQGAADDVFGGQSVTLADGSDYELSGTWAELGMYGSLSDAMGTEVTPETPVELLQVFADGVGLSINPARINHGKLIEELWEHYVGNALHAPTFVFDFPVETSPLTRAHRTIPGVVEKWDLYVRGFELGTAYSELVDPVIQRERFEAQVRAAAAGDDEAMALDEDFLDAMEYAMPPSGGMGMGIDRLLMALTGLGIRETILFPLVKPTEY